MGQLPRESPDLILLDLVMPGESGPVLLRSMRENGEEIPVLIVSALDTAKTAVEALRSGATDYIVKGFDIEELRTRVANLLKNRRPGRENEHCVASLWRKGILGACWVLRRR